MGLGILAETVSTFCTHRCSVIKAEELIVQVVMTVSKRISFFELIFIKVGRLATISLFDRASSERRPW